MEKKKKEKKRQINKRGVGEDSSSAGIPLVVVKRTRYLQTSVKEVWSREKWVNTYLHVTRGRWGDLSRAGLEVT